MGKIAERLASLWPGHAKDTAPPPPGSSREEWLQRLPATVLEPIWSTVEDLSPSDRAASLQQLDAVMQWRNPLTWKGKHEALTDVWPEVMYLRNRADADAALGDLKQFYEQVGTSIEARQVWRGLRSLKADERTRRLQTLHEVMQWDCFAHRALGSRERALDVYSVVLESGDDPQRLEEFKTLLGQFGASADSVQMWKKIGPLSKEKREQELALLEDLRGWQNPLSWRGQGEAAMNAWEWAREARSDPARLADLKTVVETFGARQTTADMWNRIKGRSTEERQRDLETIHDISAWQLPALADRQDSTSQLFLLNDDLRGDRHRTEKLADLKRLVPMCGGVAGATIIWRTIEGRSNEQRQRDLETFEAMRNWSSPLNWRRGGEAAEAMWHHVADMRDDKDFADKLADLKRLTEACGGCVETEQRWRQVKKLPAQRRQAAVTAQAEEAELSRAFERTAKEDLKKLLDSWKDESQRAANVHDLLALSTGNSDKTEVLAIWQGLQGTPPDERSRRLQQLQTMLAWPEATHKGTVQTLWQQVQQHPQQLEYAHTLLGAVGKQAPRLFNATADTWGQLSATTECNRLITLVGALPEGDAEPRLAGLWQELRQEKGAPAPVLREWLDTLSALPPPQAATTVDWVLRKRAANELPPRPLSELLPSIGTRLVMKGQLEDAKWLFQRDPKNAPHVVLADEHTVLIGQIAVPRQESSHAADARLSDRSLYPRG